MFDRLSLFLIIIFFTVLRQCYFKLCIFFLNFLIDLLVYNCMSVTLLCTIFYVYIWTCLSEINLYINMCDATFTMFRFYTLISIFVIPVFITSRHGSVCMFFIYLFIFYIAFV